MRAANKDVDIVNLSPELKDKICELETLLGHETIITSGFRPATHPIEAKKKSPGAHTGNGRVGDAVDAVCLGSRPRYNLIKYALQVGFNRIGVGADFVHLDISTSRDPEVIWLYNR